MEQSLSSEHERPDGAASSWQREFAAVLGVDAESLRGLPACSRCGGYDYVWTDWSFEDAMMETGIVKSQQEADEYRAYLADVCGDCDGTGFKGGSFDMTTEEWVELARNYPDE